ncbi:hypothetical protein [Ornithinibacillus californiensis]|uniref:hypothetical protein n=1 Tax=Ornithinibacillus californiensis TaxID=161536 RepID=UPI00064D8B1C|nr:hypothetical protein [Ornithinibacillus californiensis]
MTKKKFIEILFSRKKYRFEIFVFLIIFWLVILYLSTTLKVSLPVILTPVLILAVIMSVIKITWYNKKYNIPRKAIDWVELVLCSIVLVVVLFLVFQGDKLDNEKSLPLEMPDDFNFVLNYGYEARNIIDTFENSYTKNMILNDDQTIEMLLSDEEMKLIYEKMKEADILYSAENATDTSCAKPHEINKLKLTLNGKDYEREWITSYCDSTPDNILKNFIAFVHQEIVLAKEEYKALPEPSGGYD